MSVIVRCLNPQDKAKYRCYEYVCSEGATTFTVSHESVLPSELKKLAEAVENGGSCTVWTTNGSTSVYVKSGSITFEQSGYGNGRGGSISITIILSDGEWAKAFRQVSESLNLESK